MKSIDSASGVSRIEEIAVGRSGQTLRGASCCKTNGRSRERRDSTCGWVDRVAKDLRAYGNIQEASIHDNYAVAAQNRRGCDGYRTESPRGEIDCSRNEGIQQRTGRYTVQELRSRRTSTVGVTDGLAALRPTSLHEQEQDEYEHAPRNRPERSHVCSFLPVLQSLQF